MKLVKSSWQLKYFDQTILQEFLGIYRWKNESCYTYVFNPVPGGKGSSLTLRHMTFCQNVKSPKKVMM